MAVITRETGYEKHLMELNSLFDELTDLISEQPLVPKHLKVSLHEVTDGYTATQSYLSNRFANAVRERISHQFISFQAIPVTQTISEYKEPLILISDETELDVSTFDIVRRRSERGYVTFPVIIFSDGFFNLAYGECCSYASIIETFEDAVKEKVMVFMKSDFEHISQYICCVHSLTGVHICLESLQELYQTVEAEIDKYRTELEAMENSITSLIYIGRLKAMLQFYSELERIEDKLNKQCDIWKAEIIKIREVCDKNVAEKLGIIDADKLSSFALNIDLKYGTLRKYVSVFLNSQYLKKNYGVFQQELLALQRNTQTAISHNTAKLSLIGTFSSGKTTLINTFLGKREVPLRTSGGHNTAVLMHLYYEPTVQEYYEIKYKDNLVWTVVKPASREKPVVNNEKSKIRIQEIMKIQGGYRIRYLVINAHKTNIRTIRTAAPIIVKNGDILDPGAPFIRSTQQLSDNVEICSQNELAVLIEHIKKTREFSMVLLNGKAGATREQILNTLERIKKISGKKSMTIPYAKLCEALGLRKNPNSLTQKREYSNVFHRLEISCLLQLKNKRINLDRQGWIELCGNPDPAHNQNDYVFSEDPSCYMLAQELNLHIHAEFLQYCSLTDTPGFGSVTEEHDSITERYIRDNTGRLLVMIALNHKTMDAKFQDLINSIGDIYNNFRKNDKKNVVFILNCFTQLSTEDHFRRQVDSVSRMLVSYGFNLNNIFVCNLRNALVDKQEKEMMFGFPSYGKFHDYIIQEMISSELTKKYKGIENNWIMTLSGFKTRIDNQIYDINKALFDAANYREKLRREISAAENIIIDIKTCETLQDTFQDWLNQIISAYTTNRKGIFKTPRWDAIIQVLNQIESEIQNINDEVKEEIHDYYQQIINRISYLSNTDIPHPELPERLTAIVVLEFSSLKSLLSEADDETHWYNKSNKIDYYTDKIVEKIQSGFDQTTEYVNDYAEKCCNVVTVYKKNVLNEKMNILNNIQDEATMRKALKEAECIKQNIFCLEREFRKIKFNV